MITDLDWGIHSSDDIWHGCSCMCYQGCNCPVSNSSSLPLSYTVHEATKPSVGIVYGVND